MEETDRQIVSMLSVEGRMSYTDLAKATGLSTSAVHQRVRRLEERGVIRGYRADLEPSTIGLGLTAFISVTPLDPSSPDDVPARLEPIPEVVDCHSVAGEASYLLKVRVPDPPALEALLARLRAAGNVSTLTTVVLSTYYENRALPVPQLAQD